MFRLARRSQPFTPAQFGPGYDGMRNESGVVTAVRLQAGPLQGKQLELEQMLSQRRADFALLRAGDVLAHCHFDRDLDTGLETLWDIVVHPAHHRKGLASALLRISMKTLLEQGPRCWFGMRKLMKVDTTRPELHNIGIGILALRLGFTPDVELDRLLSTDNIKTVEVLSATEVSPPGLRIALARLPGVVVFAYLAEGGTGPETDPGRYRRFVSPARLVRPAQSGQGVIGNVDYVLGRDRVETFARYLADSAAEFKSYVACLRAGARRHKPRGGD